jgi:hypothetical protein
MRCLNHAETEAVAICKHCTKAVCRQCAHDTGHGIACSALCKQEVDTLDEMVKKNRQIYPLAAKAGLRNAIWYALVAMAFIAVGVFIRLDYFSIFMIGLGALFIVMAGLTFLNSRKMSRLAKGDSPGPT